MHSDRRSVRLELTSAGQARFDAILEDANAHDDDWIGMPSVAEQRDLHGYLDRLEQRLLETADVEQPMEPDATD